MLHRGRAHSCEFLFFSPNLLSTRTCICMYVHSHESADIGYTAQRTCRVCARKAHTRTTIATIMMAMAVSFRSLFTQTAAIMCRSRPPPRARPCVTDLENYIDVTYAISRGKKRREYNPLSLSLSLLGETFSQGGRVYIRRQRRCGVSFLRRFIIPLGHGNGERERERAQKYIYVQRRAAEIECTPVVYK